MVVSGEGDNRIVVWSQAPMQNPIIGQQIAPHATRFKSLSTDAAIGSHGLRLGSRLILIDGAGRSGRW